jgi:antitoxin component YwqK of YwqJK toxin-antitoxin module
MRYILIIVSCYLLQACAAVTSAELPDACQIDLPEPYEKNGFPPYEYIDFTPQLKPLPDGIVCSYNYSGALVARGRAVNSKLEGLVRYYYESGALYSEVPHKNGEAHGLSKRYYENGALKSEALNENGYLEGIEKLYHENGQLSSEIPFKHSSKEGLAKYYYESGALYSEVPYKNNVIEGFSTVYHENGKIKGEMQIKDGEGQLNDYLEDGSLNFTLSFKGDIAISGNCGDGRALSSEELESWSENEFLCETR